MGSDTRCPVRWARQPPFAALLGLLVAVSGGCGPDLASVYGTVTLDNEPLQHGTVTFTRTGLAMGVGQIESDGSYAVKTGTHRGLKPGRYAVTVTSFKTLPSPDGLEEPIPVPLTPLKYNKPETSGLEVEIKLGSNRYDISLESP